MPTAVTPSSQLDLFLRDTLAYQKALARYERLRPILQGQRTLAQQSHATGIPYHQLWQDRVPAVLVQKTTIHWKCLY